MSEERTPRKNTSRKADERPSDKWVPASTLPDPEPQDGWVFRWVRVSILGQPDNTHVSQMFREGWEPCAAEEHPELKLQPDVGSRFEGNLEVGGLLLCKAPAETMAARSEHFQKVANDQMNSVDNNFMRENDPRMPLLNPERSTRTTFGRN